MPDRRRSGPSGLDNVAGRYVSASFRDTIVFAVIVLVLFIRPSGVLGAAARTDRGDRPAGMLGAGRKERV